MSSSPLISLQALSMGHSIHSHGSRGQPSHLILYSAHPQICLDVLQTPWNQHASNSMNYFLPPCICPLSSALYPSTWHCCLSRWLETWKLWLFLFFGPHIWSITKQIHQSSHPYLSGIALTCSIPTAITLSGSPHALIWISVWDSQLVPLHPFLAFFQSVPYKTVRRTL